MTETEQNALAEWMLEELESEKKWDEAFKGSEDILDKLASEALESHKKNRTSMLDINY